MENKCYNFFLFEIHNKKLNNKNSRQRQLKLKIKSVAYSSQRNHTGQLDFCN